jgi:hypothetical protein
LTFSSFIIRELLQQFHIDIFFKIETTVIIGTVSRPLKCMPAILNFVSFLVLTKTFVALLFLLAMGGGELLVGQTT